MADEAARRAHAFISYVREDADTVDRIQEALENAGIPVWRDTKDLWPGEDWRRIIRKAITDNALVLIACFSAASESRTESYQRAEIDLAVEQLKLRSPDEPWLIPVRLSDCMVPDYDIGARRTLNSLHRVDLFGDYWDGQMAHLVAGIQRIVRSLGGDDSGGGDAPGALVPARPPTAPAAGRADDHRAHTDVWGNVPPRLGTFLGRDDVLADLRERLTGEDGGQGPHVLYGMAGVGKTALAIEYAYRHAADHQVIWWIPADQMALAKSVLAALAPRLGLDDVAPGRVDDAVSAVLDALRRGEPYGRWLLIFDNADQPEVLRQLLPVDNGQVIVTSRNHRWMHMADVLEVDVFSRKESIGLLSQLLAGVTIEHANRLAEELGDLPLALRQAGGIIAETAMSMDVYLELLEHSPSRLLAERPVPDYPVSTAEAWSLSVARVKDRMAFAWELLRRCAFFGPEPIDLDLMKNGPSVLDDPMRTELDDPITFSRAVGELANHSLIRLDRHARTVQVHPLIQRLIRADMTADEAEEVRHDVHVLLAAADPKDPDNHGPDQASWARYERLHPHLLTSGMVRCDDPDARRLVRNVVRYLYNVGDHQACDTLSGDALTAWHDASGDNDFDVLTLSARRADLLWARGRYEGAAELRRATLDRIRGALGEEHHETLLAAGGAGADLRARGDFAAALALDEHTMKQCIDTFGADDPRTLAVADSVATDHVLEGQYAEALTISRTTYGNWTSFFSRHDHPAVISSWGAVGRTLRLAGNYVEALSIAEETYGAFQETVRHRTLPADHLWVLRQGKELSIVRRKLGLTASALELAEDVYIKFDASHGEGHPDTVMAAMNLANARRADEAHSEQEPSTMTSDLTEVAYQRCATVYGPDHPFALGGALNLAASQRRVRADPDDVRRTLEDALAGLTARLGEAHHYTLLAMTALATSRTDLGDPEGARERGEHALEGLRQHVGADHPDTLACASNLALDLLTIGETEASQELAGVTDRLYQSILAPDHPDHPDVLDAQQHRRITVDFDPPSL